MPKRVLDIGQCGMDHGSISALVAREFKAETIAAHDLAEALNLLRRGAFDLVLVNRQLDLDGSDGLEVIRALKAEAATAAAPVMLVTNYPEYQAQAVALGATPGFGKSSLGSPATRELLAGYLK